MNTSVFSRFGDVRGMPKKKSSAAKKRATRVKSASRKRQSSKPASKAMKKQRSSRFMAGIVVAVLVLALVVAVSLFNSRAPTPEGHDVAAYVNDDPISMAELEYSYQLAVPAQYQDRISMRDFLRDSIIPQKLAVQRAEESNITITEADVDRAIEETARYYGLTEDQLADRMAEQGLTMEDVRQTYRSRLLLAAFLDERVFTDLRVSEEELAAAYGDSEYPSRNITLEEAGPFLRQQLLQDKQDAAFDAYVGGLRDEANITIVAEQREQAIRSFDRTGAERCEQDKKPVMEAFVTSGCQGCSQVTTRLKTVFEGYMDREEIVAHIWELDTGDDLMTDRQESGVSLSSVERFKRFNAEQTVPTYVFGCSYARVGHLPGSEGNINAEAQEFRAVIEAVLADD